MMRRAWTMRLKPNGAAQYKKFHDEIWPEMLENMRRQGVRNYSIFWFGDTLFAYQELNGKPSNQPPDELVLRWWKALEPYMETDETGRPVRQELEEVFHFD